jgi:signal transduction histidine kinase
MLAGNAVREGMATETLQRFAAAVKEPVLIVDGEAVAWANGAAREIDDWLGAAEPALEARIGAVLRTQGGAGTVTLRGRAGEERSYGVAAFELPGAEAARKAFVLTPLFDNDPALLRAQSEIALARIEEVQRQLLQADRLSTIGQLAAGVAHEINNPIGYVQSNLETLRDYVASLLRLITAQDSAMRHVRTAHPEDAMQIEQVRQQIDYDFLIKDLPTLLAESQEGIARVRKIIQDLREFSRAGHAEDWTEADIHAGIDSTINIVWNELKYKVELVKHYGSVPLIECLPSQLNQVFMNILVNAGHAIEGRGEIVITTHADAEHAFIEISDTGKGIDPEHLQRVFEPFFTTKPVGKGTGLGLSISYGIVKKHNGEIDVRSEPGVGTTFMIKLPLRQPPHAAEAGS